MNYFNLIKISQIQSDLDQKLSQQKVMLSQDIKNLLQQIQYKQYPRQYTFAGIQQHLRRLADSLDNAIGLQNLKLDNMQSDREKQDEQWLS